MPLLPGPLWPAAIVPVTASSVGQMNVWKLLILDRNTWYHITVCNFFVLNRNTWNHVTVCKIFVLSIVSWSYSYLLRIIIIVFIFIITPLRVFHTSISWCFSTGVWVTASLLKSPGLFSVFWTFSIMLFLWSSLVRIIIIPCEFFLTGV